MTHQNENNNTFDANNSEKSNGNHMSINNGNGKTSVNMTMLIDNPDLVKKEFLQDKAGYDTNGLSEPSVQNRTYDRHDVQRGDATTKMLREQKEKDYKESLEANKDDDNDDVDDESTDKKSKKKGRPKKEQTLDTVFDCYYWGLEIIKNHYGSDEILRSITKSKFKAPVEFSERVKLASGNGVTVPGTNHILRPVINGNHDLIQQFKFADIGENGEYAEFRGLWLDFLTGKINSLSTFLSTADTRKGYDNEYLLKTSKVISLTGEHTAHKKVYPLSWFTPEIQALDPRELIPMLPDAEADTFMLQIGRTVAGASPKKLDGQYQVRHAESFFDSFGNETVMNHTHRVITILTGDKGSGKSTLMDNIKEALELCGYNSNSVPLSGNQFNWGSSSTSDLLMADDLTKTALSNLYKSAQIKTIASNGIVANEKKGIDAIDTLALCSVIMLSNDTEVEGYTYDEGIESRFHFLQVKNEETVVEEKGEKYEIYVKKLAQKLTRKDTPEILYVYFLRRCLDRFLEVCGYNYDETLNGFIKPRESQLKETFESNRQVMIINESNCYPKELVVSSRKLIALNQSQLNFLKTRGIDTHALEALHRFIPNAENDTNLMGASIYQLFRFLTNLDDEIKKCFDLPKNIVYMGNVDASNTSILPQYKRRHDELLALRNWIMPSGIFTMQDIKTVAREMHSKMINNPHITNKELFKFLSTMTVNSKGYLPVTPGIYDKYHRVAKAQDNIYLAQFGKLMESSNDGYLALQLQKPELLVPLPLI